jgi:hypothetical protein
MILNLTDDQRQAIEERGGAPIPLFEEDFDPRETYPFIDEVLREDDALDPTLDSYQDSRGRPS